MRASPISISKINLWISTGFLLFVYSLVMEAQTKPSRQLQQFMPKNLVEETIAAHPEIASLELSATPPAKSQCVTVASNDPKDIGEKCDKDEFTAMKTNQPFIEKEKEYSQLVYDVTIPIHDTDGKIIGTAGIDFKANKSDAQVNQHSQQSAKELESKTGSREKLFQPAN